jgi:nitrogen fixation protein FixH
MMKTLLRCFVVGLAFVPLSDGVIAAEAADAEDNPLEPLSWLAEGTWIAEVKSPNGKALTVHGKFDWAANKRALKYAIVFKDKSHEVPHCDGMYWWDPSKKQVRLLQVDAEGNVTESVLDTRSEPLKQQNRQTRPDGTMQEQRVEISRNDDDSFQMRAFMPKDGEWVQAAAFDYRRVRDK